MGFSEVSSILWRERQLLELLLFKLDQGHLLLAAGRIRWLARATAEVDRVLARIDYGEVARAVEVEAVAADLGLPSGPTLGQLAEAAPEPWKGILADHRRALLTLVGEIAALAEANRDLLSRGYTATLDTLAWLGTGEPEAYPAADVVGAQVIQRSLDDFLG